MCYFVERKEEKDKLSNNHIYYFQYW